MQDVRACDGRGRGGKRIKILGLIEGFWDEIEGDFARYLNIDARDWIKGIRPWASFLVHANYVAQIDGSRLWAAQLSDERFLPEIRKALKEKAKTNGSGRPPLAGWDRMVDMMHRVAVELRMLRSDLTHQQLEPFPGPLFPGEIIRREDQDNEVSKLMATIERGRMNWKEANARLQRR